ncbi:MAG: acetyl-CoA carboxylase carboxyltransferase subunit alpha [Candidatus Omnitrophica bacterium]|nr:acetyl-CoA carboxylase carboxyltransferase subunit alpha [Candidatus Omnitrophota bacterium]MBU4478092.1 acetyl-CoA carboxylase carboxyltransferase subunit alpha [Candidatus Omnitrophota bacterium]MCG2704154.1 acetyl-CoA carboxylase carboxyltransferase subunit alpha [Candidatus Omnitrophota bacterium]
MNDTGLDFEKPIVELEQKIVELRSFSQGRKIDLQDEIVKFEEKLEKLKREIFDNLSPWQKVQIARHPKRPYTLDYISLIMTDFIELHGDQLFRDDPAIICGLAKIDGEKIMLIGHQKGKDTKENLYRSFGSAHPEGYRKAMRLMELAGRFKVPVVTFIDTPGAYPGIDAEERGQAEAIAHNLQEMAALAVPVIVVVIGEGGSGGALGIGIGDRICMLENAYYSVISPEGCAAILWRNRIHAPEAAAALKITADDLLKLGIIDEIIPEPLGGAHRDYKATAEALKASLKKNLAALKKIPGEELVLKRYEKFRKMGMWEE